MVKAKRRFITDSIQVFRSYISFESTDPDMEESSNIRSIVDSNAILVEELSQNRRIIIWFVRRVISSFQPKRNCQFSETEIAFIHKTVPCVNEWTVNIGITCFLLNIDLRIPKPPFANFESLKCIDPKHIEDGALLLEFVIIFQVHVVADEIVVTAQLYF